MCGLLFISIGSVCHCSIGTDSGRWSEKIRFRYRFLLFCPILKMVSLVLIAFSVHFFSTSFLPECPEQKKREQTMKPTWKQSFNFSRTNFYFSFGKLIETVVKGIHICSRGPNSKENIRHNLIEIIFPFFRCGSIEMWWYFFFPSAI